MNISPTLHILAALAPAATRLQAYLNPEAAYGFTGINTTSPGGVSEILAVFGGLFIGMGTAPLFAAAVHTVCPALNPRNCRFTHILHPVR